MSLFPADKTAAEREYAEYVLQNDEDDAKLPDVLLDVPVVKVDEINFELNDLRVRANLFAKVLDLVELAVGVDAYLGRVKLVIQGVEAQALLKVRLDNVAAILDRVLTTIDRNPQIVERLVEGVSSAVEDAVMIEKRESAVLLHAGGHGVEKLMPRPRMEKDLFPVESESDRSAGFQSEQAGGQFGG